MGKLLQFQRPAEPDALETTVDILAARMVAHMHRNPFTWAWAAARLAIIANDTPPGCTWVWFLLVLYPLLLLLRLLAPVSQTIRAFLMDAGVWSES